MSDRDPNMPLIQNSFLPETIGALRALNLAFADVVLENHKLGLPVIQYRDGRVVETPTEELLAEAHRILATNGEPLPCQLGQ
jgi:hypothetical protein